MSWYDDLMKDKQTQEGIPATNWYDEMMEAPSSVKEEPGLGWGETLREVAKPSPVAEATAHLAVGMATWIPAKLSGIGQIGLQKISNAIFSSEAESLLRTPEERELFKKGVLSPEKIREMAEQSESLWSLLPPPGSEGAKVILEKVEKGLDAVLTPFRIADEYYTKIGSPNLGYMLRFAGELIFFKAAHLTGKRLTNLMKKGKQFAEDISLEIPKEGVEGGRGAITGELTIEQVAGAEKKIKEIFDTMDTMEEVPAKPTGRELKGVTKSQKIKAHTLARAVGLDEMARRDLAEQVTGVRSMKEMNRESAGKFIEALKERKKPVEAKPKPKEEVKVEEEPTFRTKAEVEMDGAVDEMQKIAKKEVEVEKVIEKLPAKQPVKFIGMQKVGNEMYPLFEATTGELKGGQIDYIPERHRIINLAEYEKGIPKLLPSERPISEAIKLSIADDIRTAQDMGFYADIKEMISKKKKIGQIMKELKQKAYYKEDLKDFDFTEKDIRDSIRAIRAEVGDQKAIRLIQKGLKEEEIAVGKVPEELEIPADIERVSPVTGRLPGVKEELKVAPKEIDEIRMRYELGQLSITGETGKILKTKIAARVRSEELGMVGNLVKNPKGEGWILKKTKAERKIEVEERKKSDIREQKEWEDILKEEELDLTEEGLGKKVDVDVEDLWGERGAITFDTKTVDKMKSTFVKLWKKAEKVGDDKLVDVSMDTVKYLNQNDLRGLYTTADRLRKMGQIEESNLIIGSIETLIKPVSDEVKLRIHEAAESFYGRSVLDVLKTERGAITLDAKTVKKIQDLIRKGAFSRNRAIKELRVRGATDKDILKVFPDASVQILNKDVESKWLKPGQDPLAILPRRKLPSGLKAPAVTRGEAHMIATMKDMPARLTAEHFSMENAIRTFEKLPEEMKETFYRTVKEGESLTYDRLYDLIKRTKKIRNSVPYTSHKRIGIHTIAQQPDGLAVLAQQGIVKIPKLKPKELKAYEDLRTIFDELYPLINKARVAAGEKPFPAVKNYFTWIQDLHWVERTQGAGLFSDWRTLESKMAEIKRVPSFRFAKFRAGPEMPRQLNLNPFTVIDVYAKTASHYIEMGPRLAKLNELLTEKFGMSQNAPNAYNFIRHWLNYQAGKIPAWDIAHPKTRRAMQILNTNIVYSLLAFNVRSALIQPAALASSYAILGEYYMGVGLAHMMSPAKWKMVGKKSNIINTRTPEQAMFEAMEADVRMIGQIQRRIGQVGLIPLTVLDSVAARITWLGAYEMGLKKLKFSEKRAINYADDVVTRTQASAARSDVAPIQRAQIGKTVTCLQTFVINHWGFLTKDVMGIKNANIKNPVIFKRVIRFILATTAMNAFYEDVLGVNSPNPTPIRAYREEFERSESHVKAFVRSVKELAEYIPIWGGKLRYGSELGGPVLSESLKLIEEGDVAALTKLQGIPGANQFFKMVRAYERAGTPLDLALGRYVEPPKKGIPSIKGIGPIELP